MLNKLTTRELADKAFLKGIITNWEHELILWQLGGSISQDELDRIITMIYDDIRERFELKKD